MIHADAALRTCLCIALAACPAPAPAPAAEPDATPDRSDPLVTDRPDFTESTSAVAPGRFQLEMGYTFTSDSEDGVRVRDHTFPEALLRAGLVDNLELRIGWSGWSLTNTREHLRDENGRRVTVESHDDGGTDMIAGLKLHLLDQDRLVPDLGVIVEASLPTGTSTKSAGDVDPQVKLLWAYDLTERLAIAGNLNVASATDDDGRFAQGAASLSAAFALADGMGMYVEYFGFYPNTRHTDAAHYLNGGFTFPVSDDLQFDIRAGAGLNEEADDFFAGAGFAIRW